MDAAEVEPLHFITPSAEFIIFSWRLSELCGSRFHLIITYKLLVYYHTLSFTISDFKRKSTINKTTGAAVAWNIWIPSLKMIEAQRVWCGEIFYCSGPEKTAINIWHKMFVSLEKCRCSSGELYREPVATLMWLWSLAPSVMLKCTLADSHLMLALWRLRRLPVPCRWPLHQSVTQLPDTFKHNQNVQ